MGKVIMVVEMTWVRWWQPAVVFVMMRWGEGPIVSEMRWVRKGTIVIKMRWVRASSPRQGRVRRGPSLST